MRTVCKKDNCVGCMACVDICKKSAIRIEDTLSAYNAVIDENKCINCMACEKICQNNTVIDTYEPKMWNQGWTKNKKIRRNGASGGVAMELAYAFIQNGGKVCSCTFDKGEFVFKIIDNVEKLNMFAGSKYVKSNPKGIYRKVKQELTNKNKVLFIGLPCQVAALKKYVGVGLEENLTTIDLICHGTPSPQILSIFLKQYNKELSGIKDIMFRVKGKFQVSNNNGTIATSGCCDRYMTSFLSALTYTENCYQCIYAKKQRVGDVTLGDSWGSDLPENEWKKGISLILCQTSKGEKLLSIADVDLYEVDKNIAVKNNHQLVHPSVAPNGKAKFFKELKKGKKFNILVAKALPKECFKQDLKALLIKIGLISGGGISYQIKISE